MHYNPNDELALSSVPFYRNELNLKEDEFIYRDPDIALYQESYVRGNNYLICSDFGKVDTFSKKQVHCVVDTIEKLNASILCKLEGEIQGMLFYAGKEAYNREQWLEAMDAFENSLILFKEALNDCYLLCEDVIYLNLTQPNMNSIKKSLLEEYGLISDTMEYYELLAVSIKEVIL